VPETRFFCENCGAEVPRDEKKCPECGRFFASVRCPSCGFIGEQGQFKEGCPICGYSTAKPPSNSKKQKNQKNRSENRKPDVSLPFWVYILTAAVFTAILAALLFVIAK
jgi:uncharacterized membrane protein YvbJ